MYRWILGWLGACLVAAAAAAQEGGDTGGTGSRCPDTKASQIPGSSGPAAGASTATCGVGLVVFGFGGGIVGEPCPSTKVWVPAHQVCLGKPSEGTRCVPDGTRSVTARDCDCGGLVIPGLEIGIPTDCQCGPPYVFGDVEDFKTELCSD
ncbi:MAG: hypothetical protein AAF682_24220 [Planctomycetota bacterium]